MEVERRLLGVGWKNERAALVAKVNQALLKELGTGKHIQAKKYFSDELLKKLQFDNTSRVRNTLIHVLGKLPIKKDAWRRW